MNLKKTLLILLVVTIIISSLTFVSAGLFGGLSVNGVDFNTPEGFEEYEIPDGLDELISKDAIGLVNTETKDWVFVDAGEKLVDVSDSMINESKKTTINGKEGTLNTYSKTNSASKTGHFFDYESNGKQVRVVVFTDDDGGSLLLKVVK